MGASPKTRTPSSQFALIGRSVTRSLPEEFCGTGRPATQARKRRWVVTKFAQVFQQIPRGRIGDAIKQPRRLAVTYFPASARHDPTARADLAAAHRRRAHHHFATFDLFDPAQFRAIPQQGRPPGSPPAAMRSREAERGSLPSSRSDRAIGRRRRRAGTRGNRSTGDQTAARNQGSRCNGVAVPSGPVSCHPGKLLSLHPCSFSRRSRSNGWVRSG